MATDGRRLLIFFILFQAVEAKTTADGDPRRRRRRRRRRKAADSSPVNAAKECFVPCGWAPFPSYCIGCWLLTGFSQGAKADEAKWRGEGNKLTGRDEEGDAAGGG
jgi:hypothetical protein